MTKAEQDMTKQEMKRTVLAISGSGRKGSSCEAILHALRNSIPAEIEFRILEGEEGIDRLPHFNPDVADAEAPPSVLAFRERVASAEGVLICTPEYIFSLPAVLKNALEWTVSTTIFSGKPVAFIIASPLGEKAFESLDLILKTLQCEVAEDAKLLVRGARSKVNSAGEFIDAKTAEAVGALVTTLCRCMENKGIS